MAHSSWIAVSKASLFGKRLPTKAFAIFPQQCSTGFRSGDWGQFGGKFTRFWVRKARVEALVWGGAPSCMKTMSSRKAGFLCRMKFRLGVRMSFWYESELTLSGQVTKRDRSSLVMANHIMMPVLDFTVPRTGFILNLSRVRIHWRMGLSFHSWNFFSSLNLAYEKN